MCTTLSRTLTEKSLLKIGKHKDLTVGFMLEGSNQKKIQLISIYYKLTSINFTESVLEALKITKEWRIKKPSANPEMYLDFLKEHYPKENIERNPTILKMQYSGREKINRSNLQAKNHGH